ncbi:hypothetical protein AB685_04520 [Bacillus sp. LL01]|uniref:YqgU-like beta propeller domain-containing protein n=1 Tax=Bacillus sp. LL01 TaxID=1665556 RepID=UPI00064D479B|nr:hypothetical protein [Bacillus sp. LL01]KMJ60107.1 hypothetical protein AB685_04520 [Bacillus sp. LL01]
MKKIFFIGTIIFCLLSGCQSPPTPKEVSNAPLLSNHAKPKPFNPLFFHNESYEKLSIPAEQFSTVAEWLNDETILYIANDGDGSKVLSFDLFTGVTEIFFESEEPVISVTANKDFDLFLVRSAPSYTEGKLSVLSESGELKAEWKFDDSIDLVSTWNPFTGNQLMVSSFKEDWSYDSFLLDVPTKNMVKQDVDDPFVQWLSEEKLGYINWNQEMPILEAPLYTFDLATNETVELLDSVVTFQTYHNLLFTVGNIKDEDMAVFSFRRLPDLKEVHSYEAPLLTMYSNYFIPYFAYVNSAEKFYIFEALNGGSIDSYSAGFQFIMIDVEDGTKKVIFENVENKPLKFSPNGLLSLYGYQLEQIIIPSTEEKLDLVDLF